MRLRLAPRIMSGICLSLLCAVLVAGLSPSVSIASDGHPSANDRQSQREQNSIQARSSQSGNLDSWVYLPLAMKYLGPGIHGRVTYSGAPAAGIAVSLRFFSGTTWSTRATTTTSADGFYTFATPPSLMAGQRYYVRFGPNQDNPNYVSNWYGPDITSYTAGTGILGGSNDIANIELLSPPVGATVSLPAQFDWQRRSLGSESYQFVLFDPSLPTTTWKTDLLGDVGTYQLLALPTSFSSGVRYGWYVNAHSSGNGYVTSYYYRGVTFSAATALPAGSRPAPQESDGHGDLMGSVPAREK